MELAVIIAIGLSLFVAVVIGSNMRRQGTLTQINTTRTSQKQWRLEQIMELFETKDRISHEDVSKVLDVSGKTIRNYLDELEKKQKVIQHGKTGRGVYYTIKR